MSLKWNRKHQCYDLEKEKVIRHIPYRYEKPDMPVGTKILCAATAIAMGLLLMTLLFGCAPAFAETVTLKASWYSVESLKKEGTWKTSRGVMANGKQFKDDNPTCAVRGFALGTYLRVTNVRNGKSVIVRVTDRIGKRFAHTRIDLSRSAFEKIAELKEGLIPIRIEVINV